MHSWQLMLRCLWCLELLCARHLQCQRHEVVSIQLDLNNHNPAASRCVLPCSGGHLEEASEVTAHGLALLRKQRAEADEEQQEEDELSFADLQAAIEDAKQKLQQQQPVGPAGDLQGTQKPGKRR